MTSDSIAKPCRHDSHGIPWDSLTVAAASRAYASDLTHGLYKYPARLSPPLARALILALTKPGDVILDPFAGGGTTAVEALFHGRRVIASDINSLACFVTLAKSWPAPRRSLRGYAAWVEDAIGDLRSSAFGSIPLVTRNGDRYAPRTHAALLHLGAKAGGLPDKAARRLALLTTVRAGQLCFDCRSKPPTVKILQEIFADTSRRLLEQMSVYSEACRSHTYDGGLRRALRVVQTDAEALSSCIRLKPSNPVSLILTSPPYPGVHVLYHRWQVYGRKETSLPYHLLGLQDGSFESFYTLAARSSEDAHYFTRLTSIFSNLLPLMTSATIVAQVVGFADPAIQLPRFREAMTMAGFEEIVNPYSSDRQIERAIPHRKWYAAVTSKKTVSSEFLLLHRPSRIERRESDREGRQ